MDASDLPKTRVGADLATLLGFANGFFAFDSCLRVRGLSGEHGSLESWNDPSGWIRSYGGLADGLYFFGEDVFGAQSALRDDHVVAFDPETGEASQVATSLDEWASLVLTDSDFMTGHPVGVAWQSANRKLLPSERLVPKTPFVLGGAFTSENLYALDDSTGMTLRAEFASRIGNLPDGSSVEVESGD